MLLLKGNYKVHQPCHICQCSRCLSMPLCMRDDVITSSAARIPPSKLQYLISGWKKLNFNTWTSSTVRSHLVKLFAKEFRIGVKAAPAVLISGDVFRSGKCKKWIQSLMFSVLVITPITYLQGQWYFPAKRKHTKILL